MSANFLSQLLQFIIGIGIVIILHEMGHFLVARAFHVEVEEFGIGFPPRLVKLFNLGGTEFTLNWIPLGGFVRPKGENDPSVPGGLAASSPWVRLAVLFAGPITNLLLGVVIAIILLHSIGEPIMNRVRIQEVVPNSPAAISGLKPGDIITQVDNQPIQSVDKLQAAIQANLGKPTQITYQRGSQSVTITLTPRNPPPPNEGAIGILMGYDSQPITWLQAIPRGVSTAYDYARSI